MVSQKVCMKSHKPEELEIVCWTGFIYDLWNFTQKHILLDILMTS